MAGFNNEFVQRLKSSISIYDLISSYVPLKKRGRYYWASCPFHGPEKTPSFSVSTDNGYYYCYGCHASGDIISFIEKMEGLNFSDAVEKLAETYHIELPKKELSKEELEREKRLNQMYEVSALAASYFHNCLLRTDMGKAGLSYFEKRHLTKETIDKFMLGFSPNAWQRLFNDFTKKKQVPPKILVDIGLCGNKNERYFDMFRNRCMFPILDLKGRPVAFGGRVMDDSKPKYLNSSETPIFSKRRLLFALYQALPEIRKKRQVIMVEGYMDAISLHAHGVNNVVASLGTAFTIEQARLLKKYADEIVFSYDMDEAGQNATKRALEIAGSVGLKLRVVALADGKDPDEFVNQHGPEAYLTAVEKAEPALDYLFTSLRNNNDETTLEGQKNILDNMFAVLLAQGDTFQFNSYIRKMARVMYMDEGLIRSEALSYARKNNSQIYISQNVTVQEEGDKLTPLQKRQKVLEIGFLKYCLIHKKLPQGAEILNDYKFVDDFHGKLFHILVQLSSTFTENDIEEKLEREEISKLATLEMNMEQPSMAPMEDYIWPLKKIHLQNEYLIHTNLVQEYMDKDPEKAKEEQLKCMQIYKEIINLGKY